MMLSQYNFAYCSRTVPRRLAMPDLPVEIVIQGITEGGDTFLPSDWAERLCGVMSAFGADR